MLKDIDKSDILYINVIRKKNISDIRKKRNRTFDSSLLLSLQLNPLYQQTEPSFICIYKYIHNICIVYINEPRATSTTRTVFRLNTNQSHAYEDLPLI